MVDRRLIRQRLGSDWSRRMTSRLLAVYPSFVEELRLIYQPGKGWSNMRPDARITHRCVVPSFFNGFDA